MRFFKTYLETLQNLCWCYELAGTLFQSGFANTLRSVGCDSRDGRIGLFVDVVRAADERNKGGSKRHEGSSASFNIICTTGFRGTFCHALVGSVCLVSNIDLSKDCSLGLWRRERRGPLWERKIHFTKSYSIKWWKVWSHSQIRMTIASRYR